MPLRGRPLAPGRAQGSIRIANGPRTWAGGGGAGIVVTLAAAWWPLFEAPPPSAVGAIVEGEVEPRPELGIPAVGGIDRDVFREGESVEIDGQAGTVELTGVTVVDVVTSFLRRADGRVLLLRRSSRVGSFQGRWAAVSGFVESLPPAEQAVREVVEETGYRPEELRFVRDAGPVLARDGPRVYVVHPFLFDVQGRKPSLDWEHIEASWVDPREIQARPTVPKLARVWAELADPDERKG